MHSRGGVLRFTHTDKHDSKRKRDHNISVHSQTREKGRERERERERNGPPLYSQTEGGRGIVSVSNSTAITAPAESALHIIIWSARGIR